jgi:hypothetical protein
MENFKTGYKIFTLHEDKLYSYALGWFRYFYGFKDIDLSFITKRIVEYSETDWTKGFPWIALFNTLRDAKRLLSMSYWTYEPIVKKVKYLPYKKEICNFYTIRDFILNKTKKEIEIPPKGTIFAESIKII